MRKFATIAAAAAVIGTAALAGCTSDGPGPSRTVVYSSQTRVEHRRPDNRYDHSRDRDRYDHGRDRGDRDGRHDRDRDRDRDRGSQRACTMEYAPVCGRRGNDKRTFANACQARAAHYSTVRGGRC